MKLAFNRLAFLAELQVVARATATRSAVQALSGVLISIEEEVVRLAATDSEIALQAEIEGEVQEAGSILLPGRLLVDIVRVLDGDTVVLARAAEQGDIDVTSAKTKFRIRSLPIGDFPRLPADAPADVLSVPAGTFAETIDRVSRAASRDETRPVLTGILVSVESGTLRMVATDSYRLSVKETKVKTGDDGDFQANVPARALQELSRVVADSETEEVAVVARENQVVFKIGRVTLSSRTIEGQFPNYRQLLPESYEHEVRLAKSEFASVVRRISLIAQRNAPLRLKFADGSVTVSAQTPDVGDATETIPVEYSGEPLEIGFNPQFLQDGLEAVETDDLILKLISPLRPGLIEAEGTEDEQANGKFLYLIMPVRLNV